MSIIRPQGKMNVTGNSDKVFRPKPVLRDVSKPKPSKATVAHTSDKSIFSYLKHLKGKDIDEVAKEAGFDFIAEKRPLYYASEPGGELDLINPDMMSVIRKDDPKTHLGTVGANRPIVQYVDALRFAQLLVDKEEASFQRGGIIGNGQRAFLVMRSAHCIEVVPGDPIECYFFLATSHNSTKALSIVPSPLHTKSNTVLLLPGMRAISFKHTKHVDNHMARAGKTLSKVRDYFNEFEKSFTRLAQTPLDARLTKDYLMAVFPDPKEDPSRTEKMREDVISIHQNEKSLQLPALRGTLLGIYFAVCFYAEHYMTTRKTNRLSEVEARIESRFDGAAARRKAESLGVAMEIARRF